MNSYKDMFDLDSIELKVIRIFLFAFFILICYQAVQFINIRKIDKEHREVLMAKSKSMEALQDLLIQSSTIQRKLLNLAITENPQEIQELERIISNAEVSNDKSLAILENAFLKENNGNKQMMAGLKSASIFYRETSRTFSEMMMAGDKETALEYRTTDLRPVYESYQESQQKMLLLISNDLIRQSNKVSNYASASGWVLFFLGLLPFIYATTKLIYLAIFLKFKTTKIHK